jgi:ribose 5-phosphate isomerase B
MKNKSVVIASDHGGFELKDLVIKFLEDLDFSVTDFGTNSGESVDYPDFAEKVARFVSKNQSDFGILICGTGIGMAISANKIKNIRAVNCTNTTMARLSRQHNNANILCLGARTIGSVLATDIVSEFISTEFEGGRHKRRVDKITKLEETNE